MTTETPAGDRVTTRLPWQLLAAGLAVVSAVVWLLLTLYAAGRAPLPGSSASFWELLQTIDGDVLVRRLGRHLSVLLTGVAVPVVGAWLAARRGTLSAGLGLAGLATWAALVLPGALPPTGWAATPFSVGYLAATGFALATLVAALLALRTRAGHHPLPASRLRGLAAAGIAVWALADLSALVLTRVYAPAQAVDLAGRDLGDLAGMLLRPSVALLVLLALAAVVWRRAGLPVVAAAVVVIADAVGEVLSALGRGPDPVWGMPPFTVIGMEITTVNAVVTIGGAGLLVVAVAPLVVEAARSRRASAPGGAPAR